MASKTEISSILKEMAEYYEKDVTSARVRVFGKAFASVAIADLREACDDYMLEEKWFPRTPGEVMRIVRQLPKKRHNEEYYSATRQYWITQEQLRRTPASVSGKELGEWWLTPKYLKWVEEQE